ncbi:MAG: hypothetical protein JRH20_15250 [Deltaproteobacteria bacterium]|nr:hypothetical protein [Deltaproteobacteria bacterium]
MGILDELSSATGEKDSNTELMKRCLHTPAFMHSVAEGLRTGTAAAQQDCLEIMIEVAKRRPELVANFASDFLDATKHKSRKLAKTAYGGLALVVEAQPSDVFAAREELLEKARAGGPLGLAAAGVIASLCAHSVNYRGKLIGPTLKLLRAVPLKDVARWAAALAPAVMGSTDGIKRFAREIDPRRADLEEATIRKLDRVVAKLERSLRK